MTNGDAITKRYEVRDAETGEVVEGPLYVLRPREDIVARSAMFCYAHLLKLESSLCRVVAMPSLGSGIFSNDAINRSLWMRALSERVDIPEDTCSQEGEQFAGMSTTGMGGDGSMKRALTLMESLGYEFAYAAFRKIGDAHRDAAGKRLKAMNHTAARKERLSGQVSALVDGPM